MTIDSNFHTYKADVKLGPGQHVEFWDGKGYYAAGGYFTYKSEVVLRGVQTLGYATGLGYFAKTQGQPRPPAPNNPPEILVEARKRVGYVETPVNQTVFGKWMGPGFDGQ